MEAGKYLSTEVEIVIRDRFSTDTEEVEVRESKIKLSKAIKLSESRAVSQVYDEDGNLKLVPDKVTHFSVSGITDDTDN